MGMKLTTLICSGILILFALCSAVYALGGIDVLFLLCAGSERALRTLHAAVAVSGLWLAFWLVAFRPADALS